MDGLAIGFEPSVDHGAAAEDDALSEVPDPSGEDFCLKPLHGLNFSIPGANPANSMIQLDPFDFTQKVARH